MFRQILRDVYTLYTIVTSPFTVTATDHASRLQAFYKPQIAHYDRFRKRMLWGRQPLLHALLAHLNLQKRCRDLVWVDVGGGTGSNVEDMLCIAMPYMFKKIYIVDLCPCMCEEARKRVEQCGWTNVEVICGDAVSFDIPEKADVVTFSYSLSMIPDFYQAVDHANYILTNNGIIGVTDFCAQGSWASRSFWQSYFDLDGIKLGPERKQYVQHMFDTVYEYTSHGSIPYTPFKVPFYIWIGSKHSTVGTVTNVTIHRSKAPAFFPPTFLYHQSWEDPDVDDPVLDVRPSDTCLTLTSGGCNTLYLLLKGAKVVSVDVNPAQTALLELKCVAIQQLEYDDFWLMFGEGRHPNFDPIFDAKLAPFLSQTSREFWEKRRWYFRDGLYYQGSMGHLSRLFGWLSYMIGFRNVIEQMLETQDVDEQITVFEQGMSSISRFFQCRILDTMLFNKYIAWFGCGVPRQQLDLILRDGYDARTYFQRCLTGVARNTHIATENYFYYNIITGKYTKENCPAYLKYENFMRLKNENLIDNLYISNSFFNDELQARTYDKVILMDHVDWQSSEQSKTLAKLLFNHTSRGARVIFRSAGLTPPYVDHLRDAGFDVNCIDTIENKGYMDRVNMYASFWMLTRT